jgi:hypothetical protein
VANSVCGWVRNLLRQETLVEALRYGTKVIKFKIYIVLTIIVYVLYHMMLCYLLVSTFHLQRLLVHDAVYSHLLQLPFVHFKIFFVLFLIIFFSPHPVLFNDSFPFTRKFFI